MMSLSIDIKSKCLHDVNLDTGFKEKYKCVYVYMLQRSFKL